MKPILRGKGYTFEFDICNRVSLLFLTETLAEYEKDIEKKAHLKLASAQMRLDIKSFLEQSRFYSLDGFFSEISEQTLAFKYASGMLTEKVKEVMFLYLDENGKPYPKETYWPNNSSDAD